MKTYDVVRLSDGVVVFEAASEAWAELVAASYARQFGGEYAWTEDAQS